MRNSELYICTRCGNLADLLHHSDVPMVCCGQRMERVSLGDREEGHEKHLPVVSRRGDTVTVTVGSDRHPMTDGHGIRWVYLKTDVGGQYKHLPENGAPEVSFALRDERPTAVYAYCNLHGLWKKDM